MPLQQFGGLPPGLSMEVLRQIYNSIIGGNNPAAPLPSSPRGNLIVSPLIDPGINSLPLDQAAPSATPFAPDTTPQGPYQYNIPPNPFGFNSGGGGGPPMMNVSQDTGGGAGIEPTPIPGTFGSNIPPDVLGYPPEFEPSPTPTPTPSPSPSATPYGFDPNAYGLLSTGPAFLSGDSPGGTPAPYDPYAGAADPLMGGQPDVPTAPGATPDVAPAQALSPDVAPAQPTFPINWASPQAIPPGMPGSNQGGPQGPLYANTGAPSAPPSVSPFTAFMNWLGNIPQNIASLIGSPGAYTPGNTDPWSDINANIQQSIPGETIPQGLYYGLGSPLESPGGIGFGGTPGASSGINFQPWGFARERATPEFSAAVRAQTGPASFYSGARRGVPQAINYANWPNQPSLADFIAAGGEGGPGTYGTYAGKPGGGKSAV